VSPGAGRSPSRRGSTGRAPSALPALAALLAALAAGGWARGEEAPPPARPASYYVNTSIANNPSVDDIWERMRIAREVGIGQMTQFPAGRSPLQIAGMMDTELWEIQQRDSHNVLAAEVRIAYAEVSAARRQVEAVRWSRDVLGEVVEIARKLYAVGKGSQSDVLRSQVELGKSRQQLLLAENREALAAIRLNVLSGLLPGAPVPRLEELNDFPFPYTAEELFRSFREDRLIVKAIRRTIQRGRSMSIATDLQELAYLDNEAITLLTSAVATMRTQESLLALYRASVIPNAEQAFQANMEAYRVGRVDFPALMASVNETLNFRKEYHQMLGDRHVWRAKVESVIGKEVPVPASPRP